MGSSSADLLQERLAELNLIPPVPWSAVQAWAAKTKPLITKCFPESLKDFENGILEPPRPRIARLVPLRSQWDDASDLRRHAALDRDNAQRDEKARERFYSQCQERHKALVSLIEGIIGVAHLEMRASGHGASTVSYTTHISNSTVGAASVGAQSMAQGTVTTGLSRQEIKDAVTELQGGLMRLQDQLDEVDDRLFEFGSNLLRMVRKIELGQGDAKALEARIKEIADDAWAKEAVKAMKPGAAKAFFEKLESVATSEPAKLVVKVAAAHLTGK